MSLCTPLQSQSTIVPDVCMTLNNFKQSWTLGAIAILIIIILKKYVGGLSSKHCLLCWRGGLCSWSWDVSWSVSLLRGVGRTQSQSRRIAGADSDSRASDVVKTSPAWCQWNSGHGRHWRSAHLVRRRPLVPASGRTRHRLHAQRSHHAQRPIYETEIAASCKVSRKSYRLDRRPYSADDRWPLHLHFRWRNGLSCFSYRRGSVIC